MSALNCPVCQGAMREVNKEGVLIDTCTQCRGVWLDRGELEKLVSAFDRQASDALARPITDQHDRSIDDGGARRRDWDDDDHDDDDRRRGRGSGDTPQRSRMSRLMDFFD